MCGAQRLRSGHEAFPRPNTSDDSPFDSAPLLPRGRVSNSVSQQAVDRASSFELLEAPLQKDSTDISERALFPRRKLL